MARRGEALREHVLWVAKDVFLELGFERASMDVVAARAETSKRSLYAHFASKEKLFLAVIGLVRGLLLARLRTPGDYAQEPLEALTLFCVRYLETLLYEPSIQMCRVSMAETRRFPEGAAQHFDVVFTEVEKRLGHYLGAVFILGPVESQEAARRLLGLLLYPRLLRALFGMEPLIPSLDADRTEPAIDPAPIRRVVQEVIALLPQRAGRESES